MGLFMSECLQCWSQIRVWCRRFICTGSLPCPKWAVFCRQVHQCLETVLARLMLCLLTTHVATGWTDEEIEQGAPEGGGFGGAARRWTTFMHHATLRLNP